MNENLNETNQTQAEVNQPTITEEDINQEINGARDTMANAKKELISSIYNSINYKALFEAVGQLDRYEAFMKYVKEYEENAAEAEKTGDKIGAALPWYHFIEDKPMNAQSIGLMWDQTIQLIIYVSIAAAQVIDGTIYDTVTAPQFENVQTFFEQVAGTLGAMQKKIEVLESKVNEANQAK